MRYDVVAIGNPVYDIIITPFAKSRGRVLSGCSINALLALRRLGFSKLALVGSVGKDYAERLRTDLKRNGVTEFILIIGKETGGFKLVYDEKGDRTLEVLGVAGRIEKNDIPDEYLNSEYILLGPILQEIDLELVEYLATTSNAKLFLDPQGLLRIIDKNGIIRHVCEREVLRKIVSLVDYVKPNEHESKVLTGEDDPYIAAKKLVEWGAEVGIVTLAERGSVAYDGDVFYRVQAYRTKAIDPTGAGDVYAGAFLAKKLEGAPLPEALLFASAAASIMVEHVGPDFPLTYEEARRRYLSLVGTLKLIRDS
ncbi:MAG: ribokinase [Thermoprotei archaeon]|nr:MAG: ribokinase [Thermoprotei archaeon]